MYKKQKIEIMIEVELHTPNLLSTYKSENTQCRKSAQLNKSNFYKSFKF